LYRIKSFNKVNAISANYGNETYMVEYTGEVEYLANIPGAVPLMDSSISSGNTKKGDVQHISGIVTFTKTEKGWKGSDGKIY